MNNEEVLKKYGMRKNIGIMIVFQVLLVVAALVLTIFGIIKSNNSWNRLVIYVGQALACIAIIAFGIIGFRKRDIRNFRILIYAYALLEALRVTLINFVGILIASSICLFNKARIEQEEDKI